MIKTSFFNLLLFVLFPGIAFSAHPLITDDTGTQGKGKTQFEFIGEYGKDAEDGITVKLFKLPMMPVLSYGINNEIDIVFGLQYHSVTTYAGGEAAAVRGIGDASIELKARLYEKDGLSLALKPGISLPSGDEEEGLGNGKASFSTFAVITKEAGPWAFHVNVGYVRNEFKFQEDKEANRKNIWHVSVASQFEVVNNLNIVANMGIERNSDITSDVNPAFLLGGVVYSISEKLDIDFGIKTGLNRTETDYSLLAGITWRP